MMWRGAKHSIWNSSQLVRLSKTGSVSSYSKSTFRHYSLDTAAPSADQNALIPRKKEPVPQACTQFLDTVKESKLSEAVRAYRTLREMNMLGNLSQSAVHDYVIRLCCHTPDTDFALPASKMAGLVDNVLTDMRTHNVEFSEQLYPVLLRFFVTMGKYDKAAELFNEMKQNDVEHTIQTIVSMIICFKKIGALDKAVSLFEEKKIEFKDWSYGNYLAERTMMTAYGQLGALKKACALKDALLVKVPIAERKTRKMVLLSYLDACAEAKNSEEFMQALEAFKLDNAMDLESYNHVLINLSKLGEYEALIENLKEHEINRKKFNGELRCNGATAIPDLLKKALQVRSWQLAPSTFSDVLFNIARDAASAEDEHEDLLLETAIIVFDQYKAEILKTFDQFKSIAEEMKKQSEVSILMRRDVQGVHDWRALKIWEVPYERLYGILLRSNNPFVAMAKVYTNVNNTKKAEQVLRSGLQYQEFASQQLEKVFEKDPKSLDLVKKRFKQRKAPLSVDQIHEIERL